MDIKKWDRFPLGSEKFYIIIFLAQRQSKRFALSSAIEYAKSQKFEGKWGKEASK